VDQGAGAEPRLGQGRQQLRDTAVCSDCPADVAQLFQGDSQAEISIGVARVVGNGALQCRNGIRYAADFEAGEAEIVQDFPPLKSNFALRSGITAAWERKFASFA
jgi:hypothetical protein